MSSAPNTKWDNTPMIDLRSSAAPTLRQSLDALLETVALSSRSSGSPGYLPEHALSLL